MTISDLCYACCGYVFFCEGQPYTVPQKSGYAAGFGGEEGKGGCVGDSGGAVMVETTGQDNSDR